MLRSKCKVFFDAPNERLVYVGLPADEGYWDDHWLAGLQRKHITQPDRFVVNTTRKYLPVGSKVVDAGCGVARTVWGLHEAGFDAYGVDFAPNTVKWLNSLVPELKISVADVRDMSAFRDGYFDGVWSLGVVEHFYDGYDNIVRETHRLIRPGGYAFVTVPSMSPLRRLKAKLGAFPTWREQEKQDFYQFILTPASVISAFQAHGFRLVATEARGGFKGFKDESGPLIPILQRIYNSRLPPIRYLRAGLDRILAPLTFHTRLYVFQRCS